MWKLGEVKVFHFSLYAFLTVLIAYYAFPIALHVNRIRYRIFIIIILQSPAVLGHEVTNLCQISNKVPQSLKNFVWEEHKSQQANKL